MSKNISPKRQILKINENIIHAPSALQIAQDLFEATDPVTLVRIVGNVFFAAAGTGGTVGIAIVIVREGFTPLTISIASSAEIYDRPEDILWSQIGRNPAADTVMVINIPVDVKGMRKLKRGDSIQVLTIASATGAVQVVGNVTIFLKES